MTTKQIREKLWRLFGKDEKGRQRYKGFANLRALVWDGKSEEDINRIIERSKDIWEKVRPDFRSEFE